MKAELTEFQVLAVADVDQSLASTSTPVVSRSVLGNEEKYVEVATERFRVLVYLDGAEILGDGIDLRFEREDYGDLRALRVHLIEQLQAITSA